MKTRQVKIQLKKKKREPRRIHLLLFIILSLTLFFILSFLHKEKPLLLEKTEITLPRVPEAPPPPKENRVKIQKGMTLSDILAQYNFSPEEIYELRKEVKPIYDLSRIKAGQEIRVYSSQKGKLIFLEYDIDKKNYIHVKKKDDVYKAEIKEIPYEYRIKMIWGTIAENLIFAVRKENEEVQLALDLADLFGWDIDFTYDLRRGDSFKIIFEKKYLHGKSVGYGNILAAEFTNQGKTFQAFRYTYPDTGESDHFDLEGNSLRKQFLKSPFEFTPRITSRFSFRRLHPIRKVYRPHYGVDYAAPIGTPVRATANGTVTFAGLNGASGRMVRIRHKNSYETLYLHLRNYRVRRGEKVKSGDTIGRVGSSGESTGPHLDYRIKHRGSYINPLAFNPKPVEPLRVEFLEDFKKEAKKYCLWFDAPQVITSFFRSILINPW